MWVPTWASWAARARTLRARRCGLEAGGADTDGSGEGSPGKVLSRGIININGKCKSHLHSETRVGKKVYGSWIDEQDRCSDAAPGKPCSSGRAGAMRLYVEHNRWEHAVYLWNACEVEGRVS